LLVNRRVRRQWASERALAEGALDVWEAALGGEVVPQLGPDTPRAGPGRSDGRPAAASLGSRHMAMLEMSILHKFPAKLGRALHCEAACAACLRKAVPGVPHGTRGAQGLDCRFAFLARDHADVGRSSHLYGGSSQTSCEADANTMEHGLPATSTRTAVTSALKPLPNTVRRAPPSRPVVLG
jgi:hypothetical protein